MAKSKKGAAPAAKKSTPKESAKAPSPADRKAQAEAQVPIEAVGPGVEHEDHEGGITDSLARKGVRAPLPTAEERAEADKEAAKDGVVRSPSVRERQTGLGSLIARGGARVLRDTVDEKGEPVPAVRGAAAIQAQEKGAKIVPVVATRLGQYPADGRLRAPGEAFDYVMGPKEEKLPSWMKDANGSLESRSPDETSPTFDITPASVITVNKDGSVDSRPATTSEQNRKTGSKASVI